MPAGSRRCGALDGSERASSAAVASAIAAGCSGRMRGWSPLTKPEGAAVEFGPVNSKATRGQPLVLRYTPTAGEDVTVRAGFVPASTPRSRLAGLLAGAGRVGREPPPAALRERQGRRRPPGARGPALLGGQPGALSRLHEPRAEGRPREGQGEAGSEAEAEAEAQEEETLILTANRCSCIMANTCSDASSSSQRSVSSSGPRSPVLPTRPGRSGATSSALRHALVDRLERVLGSTRRGLGDPGAERPGGDGTRSRPGAHPAVADAPSKGQVS